MAEEQSEMRQAQHKNRSRSRNRRQPNPANRVYESNGPGVKVRGTAQHIADKYMQLGRDALASGDAVKAEGFFQYAEHYLRIIAAAQEQIQARRQQQMEQREQRMRGNGRDRSAGAEAQPETSSVETGDSANREEARQPAETSPVVEPDVEQPVVVDAVPEGTGEQPEVQADPAWGGPQPSFLVTPAAPASAEEEAEGGEGAQAGGEEEKVERKTARRTRRTRTTRRTRKDAASAEDAAGESSAEEA